LYCQKEVGQATDFQIDVYMECYVYGYPTPKITWRKQHAVHQQSDQFSSSALDNRNWASYDTSIWNSQKYLIESTVPEMSTCTDCLLSRLTVINVEPGDLGFYYINATTHGFPPEYGKIELYQTPDCQQFITHRDNSGCKRLYSMRNSSHKQYCQLNWFLKQQMLLLTIIIYNFI